MLEKIKPIICDYVDVNPEEITRESRFIEDLHFNSYSFMSFLGEVEDMLDVMVDESEILELITVGDALDYLKKLQEEG